MTDEQRLKSWIGRKVMVARSSSTEAELVRLESVTDWGIVCNYQTEAAVGEPVLIPWEALSWLRLPGPEEADEPYG